MELAREAGLPVSWWDKQVKAGNLEPREWRELRKFADLVRMEQSIPETQTIRVDMVDAIKVQFLQSIYSEDFPERGMTAWLTAVEYCNDNACYKLYFDFAEFDAINDKYFKSCYFPNKWTAMLIGKPKKTMFTAKEAGYYDPKYVTFFDTGSGRDDTTFATMIKQYLRVVK